MMRRSVLLWPVFVLGLVISNTVSANFFSTAGHTAPFSNSLNANATPVTAPARADQPWLDDHAPRHTLADRPSNDWSVLCTLPSPDLSALAFWSRYPHAAGDPLRIIFPLSFNHIISAQNNQDLCPGAVRLKSYYVGTPAGHRGT